jgi:hypothetical protein
MGKYYFGRRHKFIHCRTENPKQEIIGYHPEKNGVEKIWAGQN